MKQVLVLLPLVMGLTPIALCQDLKCYCYENEAPFMLSTQDGSKTIVEWIMLKGDSAVVSAFSDRSCFQSLEFFREQFKNGRDKNRIYPVTSKRDSISFNKTLNFEVNFQPVLQEYMYNAKVFSDSLVVRIEYPKNEQSGSVFNDMFGPPNRTYIRCR